MGFVTADLTFIFITIMIDVFILLSSLITMIMIMYHLFTKSVKKDDYIILIFNAYILFFMIIAAVLIILFCCNTILGQVYDYDFRSSWCTYSGYLFIADLFVLYNIFTTQAIYRLCRIVYPSKKYLRSPNLYKLIGPIALIIGLAIVSPLLIWHDIDYLSTEHYCFIAFTNIRGIMWIVGTSYGTPMLIIFFVYFRIATFLHNQSTNVTINLQRRQQRDIIAIKRIVITFVCLVAIGLPTLVNFIIANINHAAPQFSYRTQWLSGSISSAALCVIIMMFTSQVKRIILSRFYRNQVHNNPNQLTQTNVPLRTMTIITI